MSKKLKISIFVLTALLVVSCGKKEEKTETTTTETAATKTEETKTEEKGKLSKEQQNALVFGAVLAARNDMPYDELTPGEYKDASIQVLGSSWEITFIRLFQACFSFWSIIFWMDSNEIIQNSFP